MCMCVCAPVIQICVFFSFNLDLKEIASRVYISRLKLAESRLLVWYNPIKPADPVGLDS